MLTLRDSDMALELFAVAGSICARAADGQTQGNGDAARASPWRSGTDSEEMSP